MTFTQLQYFIEVLEKKSFTKAAEALYVSQPALSKAIRQLEYEFNCPLLDRNGKTMVPTAQGKVFLAHAKKIVSTYETQCRQLKEALLDARETLSVGIPPTAGAMGFFEVLNTFKKNHPNVEVEIEEFTSLVILSKVLEDQLDFGIVINAKEDPRLVTIPICKSEAVLVTSTNNPLAQKGSVSFSELDGTRFLMISQEYMFYDVLMEKFKTAGVKPDIFFSSYFWEGLFEMAACDLGVTILPKPLVHRFNNERVAEVRLENPSFPYSISVICKKDRIKTPGMLAMMELCRKTHLTS